MSSVPNFSQLRKTCQMLGKANGTCRECSPYYYSKNSSISRERTPGTVANWVSKNYSILLGTSPLPMPTVSWSGKWPRSLCQQLTEAQGTKNFWDMVEKLYDLGWFPQVDL